MVLNCAGEPMSLGFIFFIHSLSFHSCIMCLNLSKHYFTAQASPSHKPGFGGKKKKMTVKYSSEGSNMYKLSISHSDFNVAARQIHFAKIKLLM